MKEVRFWLEGDRDYKEGVSLWREHTPVARQSKVMAMLLKNGPCSVSEQRLVTALTELVPSKPVEKKKQPKREGKQPEPTHRVIKSLEGIGVLPPEVKAIWDEIRSIAKEMGDLKGGIRHCMDDDSPEMIAKRNPWGQKIVALGRKKKKLGNKIQHYREHGCLPDGPEMVTIPRKEVKAMILDWKADANYVSRYKNVLGKKEDVKIREERLRVIQKFLNE